MKNCLDRSLRPNPNGDCPQVDPTAYIHPTARVIVEGCLGPINVRFGFYGK